MNLNKVQIISAQWLGSLNNVYIEVEIYGIPSDTIRKEFRTKMQKGPNPTWGIHSDTFTIRKVISPHMALLRLAVYEENSNKVLRLKLDVQGGDYNTSQVALYNTQHSFIWARRGPL